MYLPLCVGNPGQYLRKTQLQTRDSPPHVVRQFAHWAEESHKSYRPAYACTVRMHMQQKQTQYNQYSAAIKPLEFTTIRELVLGTS